MNEQSPTGSLGGGAKERTFPHTCAEIEAVVAEKCSFEVQLFRGTYDSPRNERSLEEVDALLREFDIEPRQWSSAALSLERSSDFIEKPKVYREKIVASSRDRRVGEYLVDTLFETLDFEDGCEADGGDASICLTLVLTDTIKLELIGGGEHTTDRLYTHPESLRQFWDSDEPALLEEITRDYGNQKAIDSNIGIYFEFRACFMGLDTQTR